MILTPNDIMLIKHARALTRFLGKLGVKCLTVEDPAYMERIKYRRSYGLPDWMDGDGANPRYIYGWGLNDAKDNIVKYVGKNVHK